ncbi:MAG TPA: sugar kinase [Anaerolineales bacterium]|nr:sugar kinase [Anaerolineales bacterium]
MIATVLGNVTLDILCHPVNDVPRHDSISFEHAAVTPGGCGSNTAIGLAALGIPTGLIAHAGDDDSADLLFRYWKKVGVDTRLVRRTAGEITGVSVGLVDDEHQPRFVHTSGANRGLSATAISPQALIDAGTRFFHIAGFFILPGLTDGLGDALAQLQAAGIATSLDVVFTTQMENPRLRAAFWEALPHLDVLFCNDYEALRLSNEPEPEQAAAIFRERGARAVIVKLGAEGCYILSEEFSGTIPALSVPVVDTTGAGDAFAAGFIAARSRGESIRAACKAGNQAGARVVQKLGAIAGWL